MRQSIRAAVKGGAENVAVVCGAWHAPALVEPGPAAPDQRTLRGMAKVKVATTWVPWTYGLLARESGYGAGVDSPAWYDQLFDEADDPVARWLARAARCCAARGSMRAPRRSSTPSRLAGALAGIRDRPLAGLDELLDATRAVLCLGSDVPLALVRAELVVGHRLGEVPEDTPMVPLQQDVARLQRRLRLKAEALVKEVTLDLRREIDRERSRLLHRLNLLDVPWGSLAFSARAGDVQGVVPARVVPGARARADPRRPLGDDGRGRRRGAGEGARGRGGACRLAGAARGRRAARRSSGRARGGAARARRPRRARPRHRRPDDRRPAAGGDPPLRGRARQRHVVGGAGAARHRAAGGDRPAGRGRRRRRGDRPAARGGRGRRQLRARAAPGLGVLRARGARRCSGSPRASGCRGRWPAARPGCCTTRASSTRRCRCRARSRRARTPERGASWIEGFIGTSGLVLVHDPELLAVLDGWVASVPRTPSPTSSRSCAAPSPSSPRASAAASASACDKDKGPGPLSSDRIDVERARPALETVARLLGG